jgi:hypothetical protein
MVVPFEMPNQINAKMAQIAADTVLTTDSTGSQKLPRRRFAPSRMPSGVPTSAARRKPATTRYSVMPRSSAKVPVAIRSSSAFHVFPGPGRMKAGTRCAATHHRIRKMASSERR